MLGILFTLQTDNSKDVIALSKDKPGQEKVVGDEISNRNKDGKCWEKDVRKWVELWRDAGDKTQLRQIELCRFVGKKKEDKNRNVWQEKWRTKEEKEEHREGVINGKGRRKINRKNKGKLKKHGLCHKSFPTFSCHLWQKSEGQQSGDKITDKQKLQTRTHLWSISH